MRRQLPRIFVAGIPAHGQYVHSLGMCLLDYDDVVQEDRTVPELAMTLIHEATHARIANAAINYDEQLRGRIERLCARQEKAFAGKLADGDILVSDAANRIEAYVTSEFSSAAIHSRNLRALRRMGAPEWLVRSLDWIVRRRRPAA